AKVMPNIVPFGPSFPGQKGIAHNENEYMSIDDIILNTKIFANAIYELAREE
ncbi:MAG: peptidase M20, partial [Romboutsia timonensis]|nr:peptidase M20 [Romboutsia timonensis]